MQVSPLQQNSPMQFRFPEAPMGSATSPAGLFFFQNFNSGAPLRQFTPQEVALREQEMETLGATRQKAGPEEADAPTPLPNRRFGSAQGVRAAMTQEAPEQARSQGPDQPRPENEGPKDDKEKKNDRAKAGNAGNLGAGERQSIRESAGREARMQQESDMGDMESAAPPTEVAPAAQVEAETSAVEQEVEQLVQPNNLDGEPEKQKVDDLNRTIGELEDISKDPNANNAYLNGAQEELAEAQGAQEMAQFEYESAGMQAEAVGEEMGVAYEARAESQAEVTILRDDALTAHEEVMAAQALMGQAMAQARGNNSSGATPAQLQMTMRAAMDQVRQKMQAKRDAEAAVRQGERQLEFNSNWAQDMRVKFQEAHQRVKDAAQRVQSAAAHKNSSQEKVNKLSAKPQPKFETVDSHLEATRKERDEAMSKDSKEGHQE